MEKELSKFWRNVLLMCRCVTNPSTNNTTENGEGLLAANAIFQGHKNTHTHTQLDIICKQAIGSTNIHAND